MKLTTLPRVKLANLPTPIQKMPNFTEALGGPQVYIKRDDLTGLAFGGNKARKLEYLMADALAHDADYIVTNAGFHSNWCTQTVAAGRRLGMNVVLIKSGPKDDYTPESDDGNHLLHRLMGAEIHVTRPEKTREEIDKVMEYLKSRGHKPYYMVVGGSTPLGAAGYANAMLETVYQSAEMGVQFDYLVHATGSGGTQAGLATAAKAFNSGIKVLGITTGSRTEGRQKERLLKLADETSDFLGFEVKCTEDDINVFDEYAEGYGYMTPGKAEAIKLLAETEGIFLDPVYTASAMTGLISLARSDYFQKDDNILFLHTGGTAALFPYRDPLRAYIEGENLPWKIPSWSPAAQ